MFWKFHLDSSGIDTLLSRQDVTLKEILDEEDVLQECKSQNEKLIGFFTRNDVIKELLYLVVDPPPEDVDETVKYKYKNLACEVITLDIDTILEKIASNTEHLDILWSLINTPPPLNPLIASFFSKVMSMLVCRKATYTIEYLKNHDAVNKLIVHIEISAIMELFIKMVSAVESQETRLDISRWLNEQKLITKLIQHLHPSEQEEKHYNVSQLLSELVRIGRDSISQYVELEDDPLFLTLEKKETIENLVSVMFAEPGKMNSDSSVVHGISTLSSMMEIKRPVIEGMEELITPMDIERISQGVHTTIEVISTRLQDFHDILLRPYCIVPMETTFGLLDPPLGKVRLSIAALITTAVATNTRTINTALAKTGTISILMDLFKKYEWNNFLHTYVLQCVSAILSSETQSENAKEEQNSTETDPLIKYLFEECNILQRCITMWEDNAKSENQGGYRKGYMGHLTRIVNEIINSKEKGPNEELLKSMFNKLPDEVCSQWNGLVNGSLLEINKKNLCTPVNSYGNTFDSSSDGEDYHPISMSQYEGTLQQAFENYQVQPMTNEFIESFGYDEDGLQPNENTKSPFDDVGNIDFSINANVESENEKLFENICEQKIQPFEDSDSEEEDIWEEKELTYTTNPQVSRRRKGTIDSDNDSDSNDDETPSASAMTPNEGSSTTPPESFEVMAKKKDHDENMDIDTEWTANFDNVNADNTGSNFSEWGSVATSQVGEMTLLSSSGETFADFTDISKFEISDENVNSPMAVDAETSTKPTSSIYGEVKMEEDNPRSSSDEKVRVKSSSNETIKEPASSFTTITSSTITTAASAASNMTISIPGTKLTNITVKSIRSSGAREEKHNQYKVSETIDIGSSPSILSKSPYPLIVENVAITQNEKNVHEDEPGTSTKQLPQSNNDNEPLFVNGPVDITSVNHDDTSTT